MIFLGAFGVVSKWRHKKSKRTYAFKQMNKERLKKSGMMA